MQGTAYMSKKIKEQTRSFTVTFPQSLVEEIDQICSSDYVSRTSWLLRAAREWLEKERRVSADELISKIAGKEV